MIDRTAVAMLVLQRFGLSKAAALQLLGTEPSSPPYKEHKAHQNVVEALQSHDLRDSMTSGLPGATTNPIGMQVGGPTE